jgi:hypothetical protein
VPVKVLNQAVRRNRERFPDDFMFQIDHNELEDLKSQIVTSSWGGSRIAPYAFTEQGVAMLSRKRRCHPLPHSKAGKAIATKPPKEGGGQGIDRGVGKVRPTLVANITIWARIEPPPAQFRQSAPGERSLPRCSGGGLR